MRSALIVGCGDVGRRLGRQLIDRGVPCIGVARSEAAARLAKEWGLASQTADLDDPASLGPLNTAGATVFYLAPPPASGHTDPRVRHFIDHCQDRLPSKVVYISTSGVYGDCGGAWVAEDRPPRPVSDRARRRLDAETRWLHWASDSGVEVVILRCGGIYGPGRLPIDRLREGVVVVCPDEAPYSNRIHSEDLASACIAAAQRAQGGEVFNIADGSPSTMTEYFYAVADAVGLPRPRCVSMRDAEAELSPGMWSFIRESRRLDVSKMFERLQLTLRYPTLAEGLRASL